MTGFYLGYIYISVIDFFIMDYLYRFPIILEKDNFLIDIFSFGIFTLTMNNVELVEPSVKSF